jgi:carboxypeptidase family protein
MQKILALLTICLGVYGATAWGQATTSLRGTVTDPSGLSIRGAQVTIVNSDTGFTRTTATGQDGLYVLPELLPGAYKVTVQAQGFSRYEQSAVVLRVEFPATLNVQMKVGASAETVSVTSELPELNTTDNSIGQTMGTDAIENLPLPAENSVLLLSLQPGVAFNGENILQDDYDTRAGMVNGERSDQNNISLDGASNNNEFEGYAFNGILPTTPFSVEEFRVTTSNYGASEGRSSGAQISLVTKGGTNTFHGSLYEFNRNGLGEANDFFVKNSQLTAGQSNRPPQLVWNNYGGTFGGPILKDRLFFFFNYEGHRQNVGQSVERAVPSPLLQDGIIQYQCATASACAGMNVAGVSGNSYAIQPGNYALGPAQLAAMDPQGIGPSAGVLAYFKTYPTANDLNYGDAPNFAGYRFAAPTTTRENWYIGRIDFKITRNGNHSLFLRGTGVKDTYVPTLGAPFLPGRHPQYTTDDLAKGFVVGYTSLWTSHLVNNLRYGLTRDSYGLNGDANQPWVFIRDLEQDINYSSGHTSPVHNIVDTVDWTKGSHSFQFGANLLLSRLNNYDYSPVYSDALTNADWISAGGFANKNDFLNPACNAQGYSKCTAGDIYPAVDSGFNHAYDFPLAGLMGIESEVDGSFNYKVGASSASLLPQDQAIVRHWSTDNYNFFFQDTWKVRRDLSLTYGLNYQLMTPMTETSGQEVSPDVNMGTWFNERQAAMLKGIPDNQVLGGSGLIGFGPAGSVYGKPGLYSAQTKNFAPRLGIAWSPNFSSGWLNRVFGENKTSIRAGAGMYYQNFGPELAQFYSASGEFGLSTQVSNKSATLLLDNAPRVGGSLSDMNNIPLSLLGNLVPPKSFNFPATPSAGSLSIARGIDQSLKTPYSYAVDFSVQRQLPGRMTLDVAYVGHFAHRLLVLDDVATPMNLVDPASGIDYFSAAKRLSQLWRAGTPESSINASTIGPTAQYWQNLLAAQSSYTLSCSSGASTANLLEAVYDQFGPGCGALYNETSGNFSFDVNGAPTFPKTGAYSVYNSQYSSLWDWRSMAWSNYNSLQVSLNKQMSDGVMFGVNYTYSKALDIESSAERSVHYLTDSVINAWDPGQMYGPSDADLRHQINGYWVVELPFGRGRAWGGAANGVADALIGGWRLSGTTRWTSGFPVSVFQAYVWPTNWDEMGWSDLTGAPIGAGTTITNGIPNIFKNPQQSQAAFDYAFPGESGVRNPVRGDGYLATDMNLSKQWKIKERHSIEVRWSVFNVFNNTKFDAFSMQDEWDVPSTFGNYTKTLTNPRRMEFSAIYRF